MGKFKKVIFCNDSPEAIVGYGANEDSIVDRMSKEHYEKSKYNIGCSGGVVTYEEYRRICFWHTHNVPVLNS